MLIYNFQKETAKIKVVKIITMAIFAICCIFIEKRGGLIEICNLP